MSLGSTLHVQENRAPRHVPATPAAHWRYKHMTPRLATFMEQAERGLTNKEIAYAMGTTEGAVKTNLSEVYRLTGKSRRQLIASRRFEDRRDSDDNRVRMGVFE